MEPLGVNPEMRRRRGGASRVVVMAGSLSLRGATPPGGRRHTARRAQTDNGRPGRAAADLLVRGKGGRRSGAPLTKHQLVSHSEKDSSLGARVISCRTSQIGR